jgi:GNAT superfamily N-acetyltransferase
VPQFELPPGLRVVSLAERPDLEDAMDRHNGAVWPEFMLHDPVAGRLWHHLYGPFAEWQRLILDSDDRIVAALNSAPLWWDGADAGLPAGWDDQFERSVADNAEGRLPNTLGAIQIVVAPDEQGKGLAAVTLGVMRAIALEAGFGSLIACVRPNHKDRYPLMPIEGYAVWHRSDGLPHDPWLRVHARAGGRIVRASPESMTIRATIAKWREWTGLEFPASGPVVLPFAAAPLMVDLDGDVATYHDPNVWMVHDLA